MITIEICVWDDTNSQTLNPKAAVVLEIWNIKTKFIMEIKYIFITDTYGLGRWNGGIREIYPYILNCVSMNGTHHWTASYKIHSKISPIN